MKIRMSNIISLVVLLIGCQQLKLKEFRPSNGSFSILLPSTPTEKIYTGVVQNQKYSLTQEDIKYTIDVTEYPSFSGQHRTPERIKAELDIFCSKCVAGPMQAKVVRDLTYGEYKGRELEIKSPTGEVTRLCIVISFTRSYSVIVTAPKEKAFSNDIQRILDSFRILQD